MCITDRVTIQGFPVKLAIPVDSTFHVDRQTCLEMASFYIQMLAIVCRSQILCFYFWCVLLICSFPAKTSRKPVIKEYSF